MWCNCLHATIAISACIRRQEIATQKFVTIKTRIKDGNFHYRKVTMPESFECCAECKQGKQIRDNPKGYSDKDVWDLSLKQVKEIQNRGYIHKKDLPVDIRTLENHGEIERTELNYIDGKHNVNLDLIGKISNLNTKRRKLNGHCKTQILFSGIIQTKYLSNRSIRIIRYLHKQGLIAGSKSSLLQSIGICIAINGFAFDPGKVR